MGTTTGGVEGSELEAGRELDALVAERVMGEVCGHAPVDDGCSRTSQYWAPTLAEVDAIIREKFAAHKLWPAQYCGPEYSTDIAAAWEVIAALRGRGFLVEVGDRIDGGWYAQAISADDRDRWECETCRGFSLGPYSHADTAPLAICRAALAATSRTTNPEASTGDKG